MMRGIRFLSKMFFETRFEAFWPPSRLRRTSRSFFKTMLYTYMHTYIRMCIYIHVYVCLYIYMCARVCLCLCGCVYTRTYMRVCVYIYTYIHTRVYVCVCLCLCACACVYITTDNGGKIFGIVAKYPKFNFIRCLDIFYQIYIRRSCNLSFLQKV